MIFNRKKTFVAFYSSHQHTPLKANVLLGRSALNPPLTCCNYLSHVFTEIFSTNFPIYIVVSHENIIYFNLNFIYRFIYIPEYFTRYYNDTISFHIVIVI